MHTFMDENNFLIHIHLFAKSILHCHVCALFARTNERNVLSSSMFSYCYYVHINKRFVNISCVFFFLFSCVFFFILLYTLYNTDELVWYLPVLVLKTNLSESITSGNSNLLGFSLLLCIGSCFVHPSLLVSKKCWTIDENQKQKLEITALIHNSKFQ